MQVEGEKSEIGVARMVTISVHQLALDRSFTVWQRGNLLGGGELAGLEQCAMVCWRSGVDGCELFRSSLGGPTAA